MVFSLLRLSKSEKGEPNKANIGRRRPSLASSRPTVPPPAVPPTLSSSSSSLPGPFDAVRERRANSAATRTQASHWSLKRSSSASYEATKTENAQQQQQQDHKARAKSDDTGEGGDLSSEELRGLNEALHILAELFPDIRPEVFREMLATFGPESRCAVVTEQLLRHQSKWVNGRWRVTPSCSDGSNDGKQAVSDAKGQSVEKETNSAIVGILPPARKGTKHELDGELSLSLSSSLPPEEELLPLEETFRSDQYKIATRSALAREFRSLSRSTIAGVLAERNHSYSLARPILLGLAAKTWRSSFASFLSRWRSPSSSPSSSTLPSTAPDTHPMIVWTNQQGSPSSSLSATHTSPKSSSTAQTPSLKPSGSKELDRELERTVLEPLLRRRAETQESLGAELAKQLNTSEAEAARALFECQCCFAEDIVFEQLAVCSTGRHAICFRCVQAAVNEAVFGQGWQRNVDHVRGQVACLAPRDGKSHDGDDAEGDSDVCRGCIPQELARRAVLQTCGGRKTWASLQARLAHEALLTSGAPLVRCPFCTYAEIDSSSLSSPFVEPNGRSSNLKSSILGHTSDSDSEDLYLPPSSQPYYRLNLSTHPFRTLAVLYLTTFALGLLLLYHVLSRVLSLPRLSRAWRRSIRALVRRTHLPLRFACRNPACRRSSCRLCAAAWRDPHACGESSEARSLRTAVEAARTAALKRTCPRCGIAFVKESGCNKMLCPCGYTMCYVCRAGLGSQAPASMRRRGERDPADRLAPRQRALAGLLGDAGGAGGPADESREGYRHFCQHFRPAGGACVECDKCDLYRSDDQDEAVRQAGLQAELEWYACHGDDARARALVVGPDGISTTFGPPTSKAGRLDGGRKQRQTTVGWRTGSAAAHSSGFEGILQALSDMWVDTVLKC